jgi:hypothetical protein
MRTIIITSLVLPSILETLPHRDTLGERKYKVMEI